MHALQKGLNTQPCTRATHIVYNAILFTLQWLSLVQCIDGNLAVAIVVANLRKHWVPTHGNNSWNSKQITNYFCLKTTGADRWLISADISLGGADRWLTYGWYQPKRLISAICQPSVCPPKADISWYQPSVSPCMFYRVRDVFQKCAQLCTIHSISPSISSFWWAIPVFKASL